MSSPRRPRFVLALFIGGAGLVSAIGCEPSSGAKLPAATPGAVSVTIDTEPPGAQVMVDGTPVGNGPVTLPLNPGNHRLKAAKSGYFATDQSLTVATGEAPKQVKLTLVASH